MHTALGGTALYRLHVNSWSVVEYCNLKTVIRSKGWSHNGVLYDSTALFINKSCSFWLLACCQCDPFIVIEHCSVNQMYSNGLKLYFFSTFKFYGYSLGDNNYEGAQSNVNGDEVRV